MGILTGDNITVHIKDVHIQGTDVNELKALLQSFNVKIDKMANELENLTKEVEETNTVVDSAITLLQGLKTALDAAGTDPAKLAALSASLDSKQTELAAAIAANTPEAPAPGPTPEG